MRILLRVDAGHELGLGNFYRSKSLADRLLELGNTVFFTHLPSDFWDDLERNENFKYETLALSEESENEQNLFIQNNQIDIFFVDGNVDFNYDFIARIRKLTKVVFYQNLSECRYLCDAYILPSIHQQTDFFENFSQRTKIYQSLKYFTFNSTIRQLKRKTDSKKSIENIALLAGASDPSNTLNKMLSWIDFKKFGNISFTFFYGRNYMNEIPNSLPSNVVFEQFAHERILENDFLISAFGVSTYEFMYLGMPVLAYGHTNSTALAANYLQNKTNSIVSLGLVDVLIESLVNMRIMEMINNLEKRNSLIVKSHCLLDLDGIDRVVEILEVTKKNV